MNKFSALLNLFRKGAMVADPAKWKQRQIETTALAGLFIAVVQTLEAFGYADMLLDADTATIISAGVIAVVNLVLTVTTTEKVGVLPSSDTAQSVAARSSHEDNTPDPRA